MESRSRPARRTGLRGKVKTSQMVQPDGPARRPGLRGKVKTSQTVQPESEASVGTVGLLLGLWGGAGRAWQGSSILRTGDPADQQTKNVGHSPLSRTPVPLASHDTRPPVRAKVLEHLLVYCHDFSIFKKSESNPLYHEAKINNPIAQFIQKDEPGRAWKPSGFPSTEVMTSTHRAAAIPASVQRPSSKTVKCVPRGRGIDAVIDASEPPCRRREPQDEDNRRRSLNSESLLSRGEEQGLQEDLIFLFRKKKVQFAASMHLILHKHAL